MYTYRKVEAITSLPFSYAIYEADRDLTCAHCGSDIPVNSYFARGKTAHGMQPMCRTCKSFVIYADPYKTHKVERADEYLHVREEGHHGQTSF